jgi:hypothetical protein
MNGIGATAFVTTNLPLGKSTRRRGLKEAHLGFTGNPDDASTPNPGRWSIVKIKIYREVTPKK